MRDEIRKVLPEIDLIGDPSLREKVVEVLRRLEVEAVVTADPGDAELFSFLCKNGRILGTSISDGKARFRVRIEPHLLGKLRKMGGRVTVSGGAGR